MGLDEARIRSVLSDSPETRQVHLFGSVDSTNDEAKRLAEGGAPSGTLVLAREQTKGRGRSGRDWVSVPGLGIYVSLLWRTRRSPQELPRWSLAAAAAAWEACREVSDAQVRIKWPNDLLCGRRKLGGVLVESWGRAGHLSLAVGVGINVLHREDDFPDPLRPIATSLAMESRARIPSVEVMVNPLVAKLLELSDKLECGEWEEVRTRWMHGGGTVEGRCVTWRDADGTTRQGTITEMTESGTLLLTDKEARRHVVTLGESLEWHE
jgi:BirA family biotin operon repressor/biotin-[acetyl-CoA-carboxylase] ligase